jgi:hypothetical protein
LIRAGSVRESQSQPRVHACSFQLPRLKWFHYVFALFAAYSAPWLAVFLDAASIWRYWSDYPVPFRTLLDHADLSMLFVMLLPAIITFFILLPFLKSPMGRRIAFACAVVGWMFLLHASKVRTAFTM